MFRRCHLLVLIVSILALTLTGCGGGGRVLAPNPDSLQPETVQQPFSGDFQALALVEFAVPTPDGWAPIELSRLKSKDPRVTLRFSSPTKEKVAAREGGSKLMQFVTLPGGQLKVYPLEGDGAPFGAYTPQDPKMVSQFGHIAPNATFPLANTGQMVFQWRLPSAVPSAVGLLDSESSAPTQFFPSEEAVSLTYLYSVTDAPDRADGIHVALFSIRAVLQGIEVLNLTDLAVEYTDQQGAPPFPLLPVFGCSLSGAYNLTQVVNDEVIINESYAQRGLTFAPELPDYSEVQGEAVSIDSTLIWDFGSPEVSQASWDMAIYDAAGRLVRQTERAFTPHILVSWDPASFILARHNGPPVDPPRFNYAVRADAATYQDTTLPDGFVRYARPGGGGVPGSRAVVLSGTLFPGSTFDPSRGEMVDVRAGIATIGYDHPDVHWTVQVEDALGQVLWSAQSPEDASSRAIFLTWDGRGDSGALIGPGNYRFVLHAEACEGADDGVIDGRLSQNRHTGDLFCREATQELPFSITARAATLDLVSFTAEPSSFDRATGQPIQFRARAETTGFDEAPTYQWSLTIKDGAGQILQTTSLQTSEPTWEHSWVPRNPDGTLLGDGTYQATLTARASGGTLAAEDTESLFLTGSSSPLPSSLEVEIVELSATQPYVPNSGRPLHIRAVAEVHTLDDSPAPPAGYGYQFVWTVSGRPVAGPELFRRVVNSGNTPILALDTTDIQQEGIYELEVQVEATLVPLIASDPPPPPGSLPSGRDLAQATITAGVATLEVFDARPGSQQRALAIEPAPPSPVPGMPLPADWLAHRDRLCSVYPFYPPPAVPSVRRDQLLIRAKNLTFTAAAPTTITVSLSGINTRPKKITLTQKAAGTYESAPFALDPALLQGASGSTPYTVSEFSDLSLVNSTGQPGDHTRAILDAAPTLFPSPERNGLYREELLSPARVPLPDPDQAWSKPEDVSSRGFGLLSATLADPQLSVPPITALFKARKPARVLFLIHHGAHDGSVLMQQFTGDYGDPDLALADNLIPGNNLTADQAQANLALDTLFLVTCDSLDRNDYNNFFAIPDPDRGEPALHGPTDSVAVRAPLSGGARWHALTGGRAKMLGFNGYAPLFQIENILLEFTSELQRLKTVSPPVADEKLLQYAWISANLEIASRRAQVSLDDPGLLALNACAWDATDYYYIAYTRLVDKRFPDARVPAATVHVPLTANEAGVDYLRIPVKVAQPLNLP